MSATDPEFHVRITEYGHADMADDPAEATAQILEDIAKNLRTFGFSESIPTTLRDLNGNKVGDVLIYLGD